MQISGAPGYEGIYARGVGPPLAMPGSRPRLVRLTPTLVLCMAGLVSVSPMHQLTFCMLTARRPGGVTYLERVVGTYRAQNVHRLDGAGLVIIDVDGGTEGEAKNGRPEGTRLTGRVMAACDTPDVEGVPSCRVRQRTLDVTRGLAMCREITSGWVILTEDDCELCPDALGEVLTVLAGLDPVHTSMVKLSKNMCSTAFPASRVAEYAQASVERLYTHPHDIIQAEGWAPEPARVHYHHSNLFHHIGNISTEPHKNDPDWIERYAVLRGDACFETVVTPPSDGRRDVGGATLDLGLSSWE